MNWRYVASHAVVGDLAIVSDSANFEYLPGTG